MRFLVTGTEIPYYKAHALIFMPIHMQMDREAASDLDHVNLSGSLDSQCKGSQLCRQQK